MKYYFKETYKCCCSIGHILVWPFNQVFPMSFWLFSLTGFTHVLGVVPLCDLLDGHSKRKRFQLHSSSYHLDCVDQSLPLCPSWTLTPWWKQAGGLFQPKCYEHYRIWSKLRQKYIGRVSSMKMLDEVMIGKSSRNSSWLEMSSRNPCSVLGLLVWAGGDRRLL